MVFGIRCYWSFCNFCISDSTSTGILSNSCNLEAPASRLLISRYLSLGDANKTSFMSSSSCSEYRCSKTYRRKLQLMGVSTVFGYLRCPMQSKHKGITYLTALSLETTISLTEDDRETKLMIKRPPSERNSFAFIRKGSSTKFSGGQDSPELWEEPSASRQSLFRINCLVKEWQSK